LLKTKIAPRFGDVILPAVKPIMVREWVADMHQQGLSPSRIRQAYRLLSQIMSAAVANDLIAVSPCRGVRLPRMPEAEPHIVSRVEADRVIAATKTPHDALVMLLAYAGLRIGEAFAVRGRSINVNACMIRVSETVVEIEGRVSFDTPKSHQARDVALPRFVVHRLRELLAEVADDDALLFATRSGEPLHYNYWRKTYFDPAVTAAGLVDVTPHDLRASHATWVAQRHGVMAAAARLGHAHASVTTRHYARAVEGQDRTVADDFDHRDSE
jgi:integrase